MPIRQPNGIYSMDRVVTVQGVSKRVAKSLKTANKDLAKKLEQKEVDAATSELMGEKPVGPLPTFGEFVAEWKVKGKGRYTGRERTWEFIEQRLKSIMTFEPIVKARLDQIDKAMLTKFEDFKRLSQISNTTLNHDFKVIRLVLRQAVDRGNKFELPVTFPHYPEKRHDRVITPREEDVYAEASPGDHLLFFKICIDTAIEPGVVAAMLWTDVQFESDQDHKHGYLHARGTKAHFGNTQYRDRIVPMTTRLRSLLMERWMSAGRPTDSHVFPAGKVEGATPLTTFQTTHKRLFGRSLSKYKPRATTKASRPKKEKPKKEYLKIQFFRLYDLRHTALTRMGESGMTEIELMRIAGWSSTAMAARYVHPSKKRIAKAVERFEQYISQGAGD